MPQTKQDSKLIKRKLLKNFTIERTSLLEFTRQWTDLYDKNKEIAFEKEVKHFIEELIEEKLNDYFNSL